MTSYLPNSLRGFIVRCSANENGHTGMIRDMSGNEYLLTPAHWLDPDTLPHVGQIVEFTPRVVDKGRLAAKIIPITTGSLLTEDANETWVQLKEEEARSLRRRQNYYRLSHLVMEQHYSVERAISEVLDIEFPHDVVYPAEPDEADIRFIMQLSPSRTPKPKHPTCVRLCQELSLDFTRLIGVLRGSISYRAALEQTRRRNKAAVSVQKDSTDDDNQDKSPERPSSWRDGLSNFLKRGSKSGD